MKQKVIMRNKKQENFLWPEPRWSIRLWKELETTVSSEWASVQVPQHERDRRVQRTMLRYLLDGCGARFLWIAI